MTDLRAVMRAIPCRRPSCRAVAGGWCMSRTGNTSPTFHRERRQDAMALSPAQQAAVVAAHAAARADRIAALDHNLTPEQQMARDAASAVWNRILEETR